MDNDALQEIEDKIAPDPNMVYDSNGTIVATFNSVSDVDQFCNTYNHDNKYNGLKLGNCIKINDGVYNKTWIIVGFDCEANNIASDGTPNNNGYGICLMPQFGFINARFHNVATNCYDAYNSVEAHTSTCPTVANNLRNILEKHLIERNVLLSSSRSVEGATSYSWEKSYCELPVVGQFTGDFKRNTNQYDDGESNYMFPIMRFVDGVYTDPSASIWCRNLAKYLNTEAQAYTIDAPSDFSYVLYGSLNYTYTAAVVSWVYVNPMIYIR